MAPDTPTILVVAEDPDDVTLLTKALEAEGYSVVGTSRSQKALGLLESTPSVKLVVSDLAMVGMNGVEFIRRACRSRQDLLVLFLTDGLDNIAFRQSDPVLLKPFKIATFSNVVRRILEGPRASAPMDWGLGPERRRQAAS